MAKEAKEVMVVRGVRNGGKQVKMKLRKPKQVGKRGEGLKFDHELYRRVSCFTDQTKIKYGPNPKRPGSKSHPRYARYAKAKTVGEAMKLGVKMADFLWDLQRGFYEVVGGPVSDVPGILATGAKGGAAKVLKGGAKVLTVFKGPRGCSLKIDVKKKARLEQLAKELGVAIECDESDNLLCTNESADMRTERKLANILAERKLKAADKSRKLITDADALEVLDVWGFAENTTRLNVMPEGQQFIYSDTLGLMRDRTGSWHLTSATTTYPSVVRLLTRWFADQRSAAFGTDFGSLSININLDYAGRLHRDANNVGPSAIKALGKFTGGQLGYYRGDTVRPKVPLSKLRVEDREMIDIKKEFTLFDGNRGHGVDKFTGHRISVVFFTPRGYQKSSDKVMSQLRAHGFKVPSEKKMADMKALVKNDDVKKAKCKRASKSEGMNLSAKRARLGGA